MAKFAFFVTIKIQAEADTVQEAFAKFVQWRKFYTSVMQGRLQEAGILRYSIPPVHEFQDWAYQTREEPAIPGSKLMLTHRVAVGPKSAPDQEVSQNSGL